MSIKAIFPPGQNEITVNGLHQWDYGRQLEIYSGEMPAAFEVHFAYPGMGDAIVRTCANVGGKATVSIPNKCLEQTAPITAWVYEIDGSKGVTTKTITMPVIQRARPRAGEEVPVEYIDKYAEALTAINAAISSLERGEVVAHSATNATNDKDGNPIDGTYMKRPNEDYTKMECKYVQDVGHYYYSNIGGCGLYSFRIKLKGTASYSHFIMHLATDEIRFGAHASPEILIPIDANNVWACTFILNYSADDRSHVGSFVYQDPLISAPTDVVSFGDNPPDVYYKCIG